MQRRKHFIDRYQRYLVLSLIPVFWVVILLTIKGSFDYWLEFWWLVPIAFLISITVNLVGISTAALLVPFFTLIFPFFADPLTALQSVKLALFTESFGLSSSALAFIAFGLVDKKLALYSILSAIPFVVGGAIVSSFLPETVLLFVLAAALITSIFMMRYAKILRTHRAKQHEQEHVDLTVSHGDERSIRSQDNRVYRYCLTKKGYEKRLFGFGIGGLFQGGAAGFGVGEMGIIAMLITKIPVRVAIGTSHMVIAVTAILASIIHIISSSAFEVLIPWNILFMTVPTVIIGGQLSPFVAAKLPTKQLENFISVLFFVIAVALLFLVFANGHQV